MMKLSNFGKKIALGIATITTLAGAAAFVAPTANANAAVYTEDGTPTVGFYAPGLPKLTKIQMFSGLATVNNGAKLYAVNTIDKKTNPLPAVGSSKLGTLFISGLGTAGSSTYYLVAHNGGSASYVSTKEAKLQKVGYVHVNYNKHYGIQIWTAKHGIVKLSNGKAKKLAGQTNWNIYGQLQVMGKDGKVAAAYYDLGGDQYIDYNYCSFYPNAAGKLLMGDN